MKPFQTYMKASVRAEDSERGLAIEVFKLDAVPAETLTSAERDEGIDSEDEEAAATTAVVRIYEDIGENWLGEGITAKSFAEELAAFGEINRLNVHINSLGGDVFAARAINSVISDHAAKHKTAYIDGIAASAATIVACGANKVVARENTNYMIHLPSSIAVGNAKVMRKSAEILDAITEPLVGIYAAQCGEKCSADKIFKLMEDETWMTAQQALDYGFVDQVKGKIRAISRVSGRGGEIIAAGRVMDTRRYHFSNQPKWRFEKRGRESAPAAIPPTKEKEKVIMDKSEIEPSLLAQLENDARSAERKRLAALDARNPRNDPAIAPLIHRAKEEGLQPADIAMEINDILEKQLAAVAGVQALARDAAPAGRIPAGDAPISRPVAAALDQKEVDRKRVVDQIAAAAKALRPGGPAAAAKANGSN
jgi:ATP-dependent Clp protease, protease subunit